MRKGTIARINAHTAHSWSRPEWRLVRPLNEEEVNSWYDSDASKGMNSAGESKLPPTCKHIDIDEDTIVQVERARCRVRLGYGNPTPGMAKVTVISGKNIGETAYIKRDRLEAIN